MKKENYKDKLESPFELPDGSVIDIGPERFIAPEILFNPSLAGLEFPGLHDFINSSIKRLDVDLRRNLYQNIILSGGNT
jgi:centractin